MCLILERKRDKKMKTILLFFLVNSSCLFFANAEGYSIDNIVALSKNTYSDNDKDACSKRMDLLIAAVKGLSDDDKLSLYKDLAKRVDITSDDPFAGEDEELVIGVILSLTQDNSLIYKILLRTPPNQVGHITIDEYLKNVEPGIIGSVIVNAADLRRNGDKPR